MEVFPWARENGSVLYHPKERFLPALKVVWYVEEGHLMLTPPSRAPLPNLT